MKVIMRVEARTRTRTRMRTRTRNKTRTRTRTFQELDWEIGGQRAVKHAADIRAKKNFASFVTLASLNMAQIFIAS